MQKSVIGTTVRQKAVSLDTALSAWVGELLRDHTWHITFSADSPSLISRWVTQILALLSSLQEGTQVRKAALKSCPVLSYKALLVTFPR